MASIDDFISPELSGASETEDLASSGKEAPPPKKAKLAKEKKTPTKRAKKVKDDDHDGAEGSTLKQKSPKKLQRKPKSLKFASGETPYPDLINPTPQECYNVAALLTAAHGPANQPEEVPEPDNEVSGCGEVPSVLDALIRTLLSANTTNLNSSRAFKGLIDRFGLVTDDPQIIAKAKKIGVGSVDWDKVRLASFEDLRDSIKQGGLANIKAKHIKDVLDDVYAASLVKIRADLKAQGIEVGEDEKLEGNISLEHLKDCSDDEAMNTLMAFNGVGVKTAACVCLFCMCLRRSKFPVDTHVWRISKFLGWIPNSAGREEAYYHLDARIPDNLKYSLHNLLIRHGRMCAHCKAGPEKAPAKTPANPTSTEIEVTKPKMRTKKVWIGTGMMKEVIVEVPITGLEGEEGGEDQELESCVLENLLNRVRKPRVRAVKTETDAADEINTGNEVDSGNEVGAEHEVEVDAGYEIDAEHEIVDEGEDVKMEE
ncbi:DNA glycosylase [Morchella conica CCBAS932]|uniref:DNA glycosylase n=1 Tax=Morchella conica CCBAS932 TaxID=1392247 RepID=A0A3N4L3H7_9PEZI|nr:DNA glycosylase [Morchella conica CCBAS932]